MAKFLVVLSQTEEDGTPDEPLEYVHPKEVVLCDDTRAVAAAIQSVRLKDGWDWHLFEVVNGKTEQRAAVFKLDGRFLYDVEVR